MTDQTFVHEEQDRMFSERIAYESKAVHLDELLSENSQDALFESNLASRKSPNRLGTTYDATFVKDALNKP